MVLTVPRGQIPHSFSQQQATLQLDGLEREHEGSEVDGKEEARCNPPPTNCSTLQPEVKEVVEVKEAAAVNTPDRHPRPLARARERRKERLAQQEAQRWADTLWRTDVRGVRADNCEMCNEKIPESDRSNYRGLGRDVHLISHCMTCLEFAMNANTSLEL